MLELSEVVVDILEVNGSFCVTKAAECAIAGNIHSETTSSDVEELLCLMTRMHIETLRAVVIIVTTDQN